MAMAPVQNAPFITIIASMFCGVLCAVLPARGAKALSYAVMICTFVLSAGVLFFVMGTGESYVYMMGHFPAPFGNEIRAGILEALMAALFSLVMLLSLLGGERHILHDIKTGKINMYYLMIMLLFSSMLALIYTNDLFTGYVFVEINTLAACAIIMIRDTKATLVSTVRYLILSLLGSGLFLIGISILYDISGHLLMSSIRESVEKLYAAGEYRFPLEIVICLFSIGLAIKSALYPFHSWLPDAHSTATTASSAILSGLVLKGYIILLVKIFFRVFGMRIIAESRALNVLYVCALLAMTLGSLNALSQRDIKRMTAFSSVAQIGYIYLGIGMGTMAGMTAAMFHVMAHAVTKPMLFMAAGGFMEVSGGSRRFEDIQGAGYRNILAGIAFGTGALSMIGIPSMAGFVSKLYLSTASLNAPGKTFLSLGMLALSTVLNALYYIPALMVVFGNNEKKSFEKKKADPAFIIASSCFIVLNFTLGLFSGPFISLLERGLEMLG